MSQKSNSSFPLKNLTSICLYFLPSLIISDQLLHINAIIKLIKTKKYKRASRKNGLEKMNIFQIQKMGKISAQYQWRFLHLFPSFPTRYKIQFGGILQSMSIKRAHMLNLIQLLDVIIYLMSSKGQYGFISGSIAAAALQPLENIKMVLMIPPTDVAFTSNFLKNIPIASRYLYNDGKAQAFYRGITPNVLKTGFSSSIYFSMLRNFEDFYQRVVGIKDSMALSFLSSLTARIASAMASNPLSILETRYEYAGHERWSGSLLKNTMKIYKHEGFGGFFKGGLTTCYKQGTFAGLYYTLYQEAKAVGINNFVAGMISGMICTSLTHPFEIVRAEIQSFAITEHAVSKLSIFQQVQTLMKTGQAFKGLAPRVIKKPLTNTLAFWIFEFLQEFNREKQ